MRHLNVLVVEDEELARERLVRLIKEHAEFDLIAACRNCDEASPLIAAEKIDIALLDIQMPGVSGIEFSARLNAHSDHPPIIVFITAHKRFACDAFEMQAADYLLKPFDRERLKRALFTAKDRCRAREAISLAEKLQAMIGESTDAYTPSRQGGVEQKLPASGRFIVRDNERFFIVRSEQIDWIEAQGRDCILHCGTKNHCVDGPLSEVLARLCAERFVQVSRSCIVNIDSISQLQEMFKGDLVAVMKSGQEVSISRRFRSQVMDSLAG